MDRTNTNRLIACLAVSLGAGGWILAMSWNWFKQNPTPTKENAFEFAWYVTCIFSGFFVPLTIGFINWYESLPYYTAYYIEKFSHGSLYKVKLYKWFKSPTGDEFLEIPVVAQPPLCQAMRCFVFTTCILVFIEPLVLPFVDDKFGWQFGTIMPYFIVWYVIVAFYGFDQRYEDETRRVICEQEARRRVREEVQSLLEKV